MYMRRMAAIITLLALSIVTLQGCGYNKTIALDEAVQAQWSQVQVQLKRRYDLIPNLVETVKGYAAHEKEIISEVAQARTAYFSAQGRDAQVEASKRVESALSRLLLLKETYPDLKANESFLRLQDSIEGAENRITVERKRYNDAVRELNTYIRGIPGKWWADMTGVKAATYFETPEAEQAVPKVKF